jgi:GNAT superfamily N-acetyltransferase
MISLPSRYYTIQNHTPRQLDKLAVFIDRYLKTCPDAKLLSAGFYTFHPALENGLNVFCALDAEGQVRGFAPLFPAAVTEESAPTDPHHIWMILLADPEAEDELAIRELLLEQVLQRASRIIASFPPFRRTRLASDMMISQRADIAFLEQHGFEHYDGMYVMQRSSSDPVPDQSLPSELTLRHWKLESEPEQQQYLRAFNKAFPGNPKTIESLKFLLDSPMWPFGTAVAAFDLQDELIASLLVYPDESRSCGITDDVFVLPAWRGRGIAKALIAKGLHYLHDHGYAQVMLEVKQQNLPAVSVYRAMGFKIINQEVFLGRFLGP